MPLLYDEVIDFLAAGTTPDRLIAFEPSETVKNYVADLIQRQKAGPLTEDETDELNRFLQIEHLMRLAKARARRYLPTGMQ